MKPAMGRSLLVIFLLADLAFLAWYFLTTGDAAPVSTAAVDAPAVSSDAPSVGRMISSLAVPILIVAIVLYMVPDDDKKDASKSVSQDDPA